MRHGLALLLVATVGAAAYGCGGPTIPDQTGAAGPAASGSGGKAGSGGQGLGGSNPGGSSPGGNSATGGMGGNNAGAGPTGGSAGGGSGSTGGGSGMSGMSGMGGVNAGGTPAGSGGGGAAGGPSGAGGVSGMGGGAGTGQPPVVAACAFDGSDCIRCGGEVCIDTDKSAQHCGACGHACPSGVPCERGACGAPIVSGAGSYSPGVLRGGTLFGWGNNGSVSVWGEGDGGPSFVVSPHAIPFGAPVVTAVVGRTTCATDLGGQLRCFGWNGEGQLGSGKTGGPIECANLGKECVATPGEVAVPPAYELRSSSHWCGGNHVCARTFDGAIWCWGEMGDCDTYYEIPVPKQIKGLPMSAGFVTGLGAACSRGCDGSVMCWGLNGAGQLGRDTGAAPDYVPAPVPKLRVASIAGNGGVFCGIREDGRAVCWGANGEGQIGAPKGTKSSFDPVIVAGVADVIRIAVGSATTCAVTKLGEVWCWGYSPRFGIAKPQCAAHAVCPIPEKSPLVDIVDIGTGADSFVACDAKGKCWAWGENDNAELGNPDALPGTKTPVAVAFPP